MSLHVMLTGWMRQRPQRRGNDPAEEPAQGIGHRQPEGDSGPFGGQLMPLVGGVDDDGSDVKERQHEADE